MPDAAHVDAVVIVLVSVIRYGFIILVVPWIVCQLISTLGGGNEL